MNKKICIGMLMSFSFMITAVGIMTVNGVNDDVVYEGEIRLRQDVQDKSEEEIKVTLETFEHVNYSSHHFQGESLLIMTDENASHYELLNVKTLESSSKQTYEDIANGGIDFSQLEAGMYFVKLNNKILTSSALSSQESFYSVTRNEMAKKVELVLYENYVVISVEDVQSLPNDVYDIIIDPGHGSEDSGGSGFGLNERDEVLKISEYLAMRLEAHGLKVKLTRTDEFDPAISEEFLYKEAPYLENGRVSQVYEYKANYLISNHLNAYDGTVSGYQIFSSVQTSNDWAELISNAFQEVGHTAVYSPSNASFVGYGSYKYADVCHPDYFEAGCPYFEQADYYYMIRETGGQLNNGYGFTKYMNGETALPQYGAETILLEYAFIDNELDNQLWLENFEVWGEAVVKATVEYLGIPYQVK